jgi:hypothetical protein
MARKSGVVFFATKPQDGTEVLLEDVKTFRRRQRQHPADQRQVHAVLAVGGLRRRFGARARIGLCLVRHRASSKGEAYQKCFRSRPGIAVQRAVLGGFGDVWDPDGVGAVQVGDDARDCEDAVVGGHGGRQMVFRQLASLPWGPNVSWNQHAGRV